MLNVEEAGDPTPPSEPAPIPTNVQDARSIEQVEMLLDSLLPEDGAVTWTDSFGTAHTTPLRVNIRKQRALLKMIREIWSQAVSGSQNLSVAILMEYALTDDGLDSLLEVFTTIHEDAIVEIRKTDGRENLAVDELVELEEAVGAVLPFCVAPIRKILEKVLPALRGSGLLG